MSLCVGVPREIKPGEGRVALLPAQVQMLVAAGHTVAVQSGAGEHSRARDADYASAGATIVVDGPSLYRACDLVVKCFGFEKPVRFSKPRSHTISSQKVCKFARVCLDKASVFISERLHTHSQTKSTRFAFFLAHKNRMRTSAPS